MEPNSCTLHENTIVSDISYSNETPMPHKISSNEISLKRITDIDELNIFELFNTARKDSFEMCSWTHMESLEDTREFLNERQEDWNNESKFSYGVFYNGELVGVTYTKVDSKNEDKMIFGLWLHHNYWGEGISGHRADLLLHTVFKYYNINQIMVGCLEPNSQSRYAIEKYVKRYNGVFYGAPLVESSSYSEMERSLIPHYEYIITQEHFDSEQEGISTSLPNIQYEDIDFQLMG